MKSAHLLLSLREFTSFGVNFIYVNSVGKCVVQYSLSSCGLYGAGCCFSKMSVQFMQENHGCAMISSPSVGPEPSLVSGFLSKSFEQISAAS